MSQTRFGKGGELETITYQINLDINVLRDKLKDTKVSFDQVIVAAHGVLGILNRLGLPEESKAQVREIQKIITAINMLRTTYMAWMALPGAGPFTYFIVGLGTLGTLLTLAEVS